MTTAMTTDIRLVADTARGDGGAFAELYDRYRRAAYGLAVRVVKDGALAEDAVQEGFLAVWKSARTFDPSRAQPSTWILTLVHRRCVDLVRRQQRRRAEPLEGIPEPAEDSTELRAEVAFERERLAMALAQLSDGQRELLELAYFGGLTQSQLAERLGLPLGTIKSRMFTGLGRLRELLEAA